MFKLITFADIYSKKSSGIDNCPYFPKLIGLFRTF